MEKAIVYLILLVPFQLLSQTEIDSLLDQRDGIVYEIAQIGDVLWFRDNLKFETDSSYCPNFARKPSACVNGNYYSYRELDEVCPEGWRIPTDKEWNQYFNYRLEAQKGSIADVKIDTLVGEFLTIYYADKENHVNLFGAMNPLKLRGFGWIEGKRKRNKKTTTIWVRHSEIDDDRFHLHIGNEGYIMHRHVHHIDDTPRRSRKFMVKCVSRLD